jgi:DNA-binding NarL/FixJ family response regulator
VRKPPTANEAISLLQKINPDLVILDLSMPRCTAFEAAQKIRELSPDTPILFFSIHETPELIATLNESASSASSAKPIPPQLF